MQKKTKFLKKLERIAGCKAIFDYSDCRWSFGPQIKVVSWEWYNPWFGVNPRKSGEIMEVRGEKIFWYGFMKDSYEKNVLKEFKKLF